MRNYIFDPIYQLQGTFGRVLQVSTDKLVIVDESIPSPFHSTASWPLIMLLNSITRVRLMRATTMVPGTLIFDLDDTNDGLFKQFGKLIHGVPTGSDSICFLKTQHDLAVEIKAYVDRRRQELAG